MAFVPWLKRPQRSIKLNVKGYSSLSSKSAIIDKPFSKIFTLCSSVSAFENLYADLVGMIPILKKRREKLEAHKTLENTRLNSIAENAF
jgi:hypothetical protein